MHKDKRVEKKKTITIKRCLNPVFNESFPFDVPAHVLRETTIIITVMDKDRLSRNDVIGKVGMHCNCTTLLYIKKKHPVLTYFITVLYRVLNRLYAALQKYSPPSSFFSMLQLHSVISQYKVVSNYQKKMIHGF